MARMLIYTTPARGHLYPIVDTALVLRERGHDVVVVTLADEVERVRSTGLGAVALDPRIEARTMDDWQVGSPIAGVKRAVRTWLDRAVFEVDDLRTCIGSHTPDLLLVDTNAWGAQAVAAASSLPWAVWHPYPLPLPSPDAPPFGPGFAPARGVLGRLRDRIVQPLVLGPLQAFLPELNALRARVQAPALTHITDLYTTPPLLLMMTAEPFEYPRRDWPANVHLVGPGLWSPASGAPSGAPSTSSQTTAPPAGPATVLVTCSTEFQDDGALVAAALTAFGDDADVRLVCTTGGVDPARFTVPAGVVVERFIPHARVLPTAAVVVCHGGMGITQRALAHGVPVCVVPWGRDQLEVARRVVECGAGTSLRRGALTPARLRAAVQGARGCTAGAARIAAAFAGAGGQTRAASLVEGLLNGAAG